MKKSTIGKIIAIVAVLIAFVVLSLTLKQTTAVKCHECDGEGIVTVCCETCEGEGKVQKSEDDETLITCEDCKGKGGEATQICDVCSGSGEEASVYYSTFMSLVPAFVAIALALITKEVYSSLFVGILLGALLNSNFNIVESVDTLTQKGFIDAVSGTAGIFIFLVILGVIVALINKTGASAAFGKWAQKHVKTKVGASLATFVLGVLIFIDDYFNCLTVGSVMRPVTDKTKVSRAKLAYLIDATAAPVCMIAPISSWAAAVADYTKGVTDAAGNEISSLALFCKAIPYNFYSLLTFVFIIALTAMKFDYGPMKLHEKNAENGDLFTFGSEVISTENKEEENPRGKLYDLIIPIIVLIIVCVFSLVYVGGFFGGESFASAFANTDATVGLPLGGFVALIVTMIYLAVRKLASVKEMLECIPKGFIAMVPAILILTMATSLKNMTGMLGSDSFVQNALEGAGNLHNFLPAIIFIVACVISFATGTSWGTFGILIPIVIGVFPAGSQYMIIGMSACLAGSVCGDHCSPISDTTIMSSAGAQCEHVNHVSTQLPYALTVAAISFVTYLISAFVTQWFIILPIGIVLTIATLYVLKLMNKEKA